MNRTRHLAFIRFGLAVAAILGPALAAVADGTNWPSFRGADARGLAGGPATPTTWNVEDGTNVLWKAAIPGLAHSSPVVWGDRIFVTTAVREGADSELSSLYGSPGYGAGESVDDEGEHAFTVLCLDKNTGEVLWRRAAYTGVPRVKRHPKSSHANPSPACDAKRIVASFGSHGLHCYDHDGAHLWSRDLGVLNSGAPGYPDKDGFQWGFASSPVLHGDRVIIQCDVENDSFLAALDVDTGKDVWRVARDEDSTWGSPTVHVTEERAQVIVNGYKHMGGYDLATGTELWKLAGGGDVPVPTPIVEDGLIYITNAHGRLRPICAIRTGAAGELTLKAEESEHMEWCLPRAGIYMQTPLVVDGRLYCCSDGGILGCYDAKTGEQAYRERLGGGGTGFSGSAVCSDGHLYFTGESGEVFVVKAGPEFETVAVNEMGETCMSTPAISDGRLYFRTRNHLVAIGTTEPAGSPTPPGTALRDK